MILSLGGDGPARRRLRRAGRRSPSRSGCSSGSPAAASTALLVTHAAAAALHRDARHLEHLRRAQHLRIRSSETIRPAGHRGGGAVPAVDRHVIKPSDLIGGRRRSSGWCHLWLDPDDRCWRSLIWYVLNRTAFGRHVYATGDDPDAARLAGINTNRTLIAVYALAGLICAIAGWVLIGRIGARQPAGRADRQPRLHHRRGDRRHQPVRRPRLDRRHADRRADRRRVPQRARARRRSTCSGRNSPSAC